MNIETVMRKHEEQLLQLPNVASVGIGEKKGKEVILVFVRDKVPESELRSQDVIPKVLDGYETDVELVISVGRLRGVQTTQRREEP